MMIMTCIVWLLEEPHWHGVCALWVSCTPLWWPSQSVLCWCRACEDVSRYEGQRYNIYTLQVPLSPSLPHTLSCEYSIILIHNSAGIFDWALICRRWEDTRRPRPGGGQSPPPASPASLGWRGWGSGQEVWCQGESWVVTVPLLWLPSSAPPPLATSDRKIRKLKLTLPTLSAGGKLSKSNSYNVIELWRKWVFYGLIFLVLFSADIGNFIY